MEYYNGTKILSLMDIDGKKPELYVITTNRTAGKTVFFGRYFINRFLKYGEKFILLYRYINELSNVSCSFFNDIKGLYFNDNVMTEKKMNKGLYVELRLDNKICGYALAINSAEKIKKISHIFNDVERILFDEFQSSFNDYAPNEIEKFISIHTSVARGHGSQSRYVPIFLLGNNTSLLNPYYCALGISEKLSSKTKFLRLKGVVVEHTINESAKNAQQNSSFNNAFSNQKIILHESENNYLDEEKAFIQKMSGGKYLCTLKYNGNLYAIRSFDDESVVYCDNCVDLTFPVKICCTTKDHDFDFLMVSKTEFIIARLRLFFTRGQFRFKNADCKNAVINILKF